MAKGKVTIRDIAEKLGVSTTSVHRTIYGKPGVGEELRNRILEEIEKNNFVIDKMASNLRRDERKVIVLLPKPDGEDRFFCGGIWKGVREVTARLLNEKIQVQFVQSSYGLMNMPKALEELYDNPETNDIKGLVTMGDDERSIVWIKRFARKDIFVINISNVTFNFPGVYTVKAPQRMMGALVSKMAGWMLKDEKSKVLIVNGSGDALSCGEYMDSFLENRKLCYQYHVIQGAHLSEYQKELENYLKEEKPDFVFACGSRATYNTCFVVDRLGLSHPIYVLGTDLFEDIVVYLENGTLTATLNQSPVEQGRTAMRLIAKLLQEGEGSLDSTMIELPVSIVFKENYRYFCNQEII